MVLHLVNGWTVRGHVALRKTCNSSLLIRVPFYPMKQHQQLEELHDRSSF